MVKILHCVTLTTILFIKGWVMNGNNLSLYMNAQALIAEMEGMKAQNMQAFNDNHNIPYTELDFDRISKALNDLANYTTSD